MSYPDSVRYLYALGNELKVGAKFGLERMQTLLAGLDHPEHHQRFVHVAGTNGKGSTCAVIASVLRQSGLDTGLYISPHLVDPTERIQIDGRPVSTEAFAAAFEKVHRVAEHLLEEGKIDAHPSYFETVTAMAFLLVQERANITVLEVGLGGRLDATNVVTPELCVITPVHYDHETFLGNSLPLIAAEKAGILKAQIPVILGRQEPDAAAVILSRAADLGCRVIKVEDVDISGIEADAYGSRFNVFGDEYVCPLPGRHQIDNAVAAILACRELGIRQGDISKGVAQASWPGRLEFVRRSPDFVLDGAHNPSGARALANYIREFCRNRPVWLVYGTMRDKAIEEVTAELFPLAGKLILTAPNFPRALRPEALLDAADHPNAIIASTVAEAIAIASQAPLEGIVFFSGSLFVVGEARAQLVAGRTAGA